MSELEFICPCGHIGENCPQLSDMAARIAEFRATERRLREAAAPFADERRIVSPSADPLTDPAVVVSLAELGRLRAAMAEKEKR